MHSLRFGRLSRGWVFMGFYSVISAMHVLLVEFRDNQCISNSSSSLCQNTAFTRCRSENGYRPEQIHVFLAEPISMHVAWKISALAQIKFLAAEALHRVGGLVFVAHGNRFANELRKRDYVKGETWKNKPPLRVALNTVVSDDIA